MNFQSIEKKWQKAWEKAGIYEADPEKRKKFFTSLVIPYVNGDIHIGHSFTYARTDVYARYKRMLGYNTLLAQGFHATGEPILGAIERLRNNDESQIATFKAFGATDRDMDNFRKKGAEYSALFWSKTITESARKMGFSIDFRRAFITAIQPAFSRFIEWQYNTLRKKGYVVQGTHPVIWCPHCQSPTGDHDRLVGEGESLKEFVWVKFRLKNSDLILIAGTTRPDALLGQTNLWVDPASTYKIVMVNNEKWVVGKEAVNKIEDQLDIKAEVVGDITAHDLIGKWAKGPIVDYELYILPASFIDATVGSGIVYSALEDPTDLLELRKLQSSPELIKKYNLNNEVVAKIEPISIINVPGMGDDLGDDIAKEFGVKSHEDKDNLEKAKGELNRRVFRKGVMKENCKKYAGMTVPAAQAVINKDLLVSRDIAMLHELTGRVVCRCTTECVIKLVKNQWFIKYSDEKWKNRVRYAMKKIKIMPEEARNNFENTIDWLKDKACTRKTGLGTKLPWDKEWIVETLSDSTVYMAYYTIAKTINEKKIPAEKLTDEVFDYVFLSKGDPKAVAKNSRLPVGVIMEMKKEFEYFYPLDFRNSAKELVQNHLTFFIFQHVAIWPEKYWPKSIGVNGFVGVEGEKMSKSKGNIIPLRKLIEDYGTDLTRLNIAASSEGIDDADWRAENVKSLRQRYDFLFETAKNIGKAKGRNAGNAELYLSSRIQSIVSSATESCENLKFRTASQYALFESTNAIKWYLRRVGGVKNADRKVLEKSLSIIVRLLAPFTPHLCEELWHTLGGKGFVSVARWPEYDKNDTDLEAEMSEGLVQQVLDDVENIQKIAGIKPKKIALFVAEDWKFNVYGVMLRNKNKSINEITNEIMRSDARKYGKATLNFIHSAYRKINELKTVIPRKSQLEILEEAKGFMQRETNCTIEITDASKSENQKARQATPQKPGILLE